MKLVNNSQQVHTVYVDTTTCEVRISRERRALIKFTLPIDVTFMVAMKKIKNIVNLDDSMYDSIAGMSESE